MRVVNRVVLVGTSGDTPERLRIKEFTPTKCGPEQIAIALASIDASAADTGLGGNVSRSVFCL
jgi:hypothetical protein